MANMQPGNINQIAFSASSTRLLTVMKLLFHTSGIVNRRKPHEGYMNMSGHLQKWIFGVVSLLVVWLVHISVNSVNYLEMLESYAIDEILLNIRRLGYFQQDSAPCHFANVVRHFLDGEFPNRWIGRREPVEWPGYSPNLTPYDFWGCWKQRFTRRRWWASTSSNRESRMW